MYIVDPFASLTRFAADAVHLGDVKRLADQVPTKASWIHRKPKGKIDAVSRHSPEDEGLMDRWRGTRYSVPGTLTEVSHSVLHSHAAGLIALEASLPLLRHPYSKKNLASEEIPSKERQPDVILKQAYWWEGAFWSWIGDG
jgi:hypothetical protein